jgi:molecular chaperone GrpE
VLNALLPLLDDVERARQHGDLDGAFKSVGEGLEAVVEKLGLERFGEVGEEFDPARHEALMTAEPNPDATVATCAQVLQPGYRLTSGRVLRPARVAVAEPADVPEVPES